MTEQQIARTEVEVWRLAHRVGAEFIDQLARGGMPEAAVVGARSYRDYIGRVLTEAGYPVGQPQPSTPVRAYVRPRLKACVEAWPGAEIEGDHDPRCCRFPKSCSASVYSDDHVKPDDLEGPNLGECQACTHPGALHGEEGCTAQWVQDGELRTCPCMHAGHEFVAADRSS